MANPSEQTNSMVDLKGFRVCNNIRQKDVGDFLGLTVAFISAVERGLSRLPTEHLIALLNNDKGWDTTYLTDGDPGRYVNNNYGHIGQHVQNNQNCPINNFQGYTKEDVDREVYQKLAIAQSQIDSLEREVQHYREENAYLKSVCDKKDSMIEDLQNRLFELTNK